MHHLPPAFQVLFSNQGSQGLLRTPSDQQLENEFGTKKDVDVVQQILEKGAFKEADALRSGTAVGGGGGNIARGGVALDTRGSGKRTTGV